MIHRLINEFDDGEAPSTLVRCECGEVLWRAGDDPDRFDILTMYEQHLRAVTK